MGARVHQLLPCLWLRVCMWAVGWRWAESKVATQGASDAILFGSSQDNATLFLQPMEDGSPPYFSFGGPVRAPNLDALIAAIASLSGAVDSLSSRLDLLEVTVFPPLLSYLNTNAESDAGDDYGPCLVLVGGGGVLAAWDSTSDSLGGKAAGGDADILYALSLDQGRTWSGVSPLNSNALSDSGEDAKVKLAYMANSGTVLAVWESTDSLGGTTGTDKDIFFATSVDDGRSWARRFSCLCLT